MKSVVPRIIIDALFRYVPANLILHSNYGPKSQNVKYGHSHKKVNNDLILRLLINGKSEYTESELENRLNFTLDRINLNSWGKERQSTIFNLLAQQSFTYLNNYENTFEVKFDHLLRWRNSTNKLGTDLFV